MDEDAGGAPGGAAPRVGAGQGEDPQRAYDLAVLDEINTALAIARFPVDDVLPLAEVLALIDNRPAHTHLVLTGRSAHPAIVERADLVTVMEPLKHYYDRGIPAVYGIEL